MLKNSLRAIVFLSFIEGCLISYRLASFSVLSPSRLVSLTLILLVSIALLIFFFFLGSEKNSNRIIQQIIKIKNRELFSFFCLLLAITAGTLLLQKDQWLSLTNQAVYERTIPLVVWLSLIFFQFGLALFLPDLEQKIKSDSFRRILKATALLLGIFLAAWLFVSVTRLGLTADIVGLSWGTAGAPITFPQIAVVFSASLWLAFASLLLTRNFPSRNVRWLAVQNILLFLGLWILAVLLWSNQPMRPSHFAPNPVPPNNVYYPNSDAAVFDRSAYHLLTGLGFSDHLIRRPLYVGMLALFHALAGSGYDNVIFLQILVLAFIPALIFWVTSSLSNRLAGLLAAGLIILREKNAIELSGEIVAAHAKLMMSDLVATLGIILAVAIAIKLLKRVSPDPWLAAVFGACLGLTVLVRAQALILIPVFALWILLARRSLKLAGKEWAWMLIGLTLVLAPWLWRNWNLTGTLVLDDRGEERLMARNYSASPVSLPTPREGESDPQFSARLKQEVFTFMLEHPADVTFFISNHFMHILATSAVNVAPLFSNDSPLELVAKLPFWGAWGGNLPENSNIFLPINLLLLAFGIALTQEKHKLTGWLPLAIFLMYSAGNALARSSGWRFSLPVDWVILVYFSIALAYLPSRLASITGAASTVEAEATGQNITPPALGFLILLGLFLVGSAVPLAERLIPAADLGSLNQQAEATLDQKGILTPPELAQFLKQADAVEISGLILYPRFYRPNGRIYLDNMPEDKEYLHFWVINQEDVQIVLPLYLPPNHFPQAEYITVIGCRQANYVLARVVILHGPTNQAVMSEPNTILSCELK
jgi:hypothetical protein